MSTDVLGQLVLGPEAARAEQAAVGLNTTRPMYGVVCSRGLAGLNAFPQVPHLKGFTSKWVMLCR